jgi:hypothetical protein
LKREGGGSSLEIFLERETKREKRERKNNNKKRGNKKKSFIPLHHRPFIPIPFLQQTKHQFELLVPWQARGESERREKRERKERESSNSFFSFFGMRESFHCFFPIPFPFCLFFAERD